MREKLIELLAEDYPCDYEDCEKCPFYDDGVACLSRLKEILADHLIANGVTIDPESLRPTGEWIVHEFEEEPCYGTEYECPVCGMYQYDNTNYCPNCGAKMKEAT